MLSEPTLERRDTDAPKGLPRQRRSLAVVFFGTTEQRVEAVAITVLILAGLGYWTYTGVKRSLEEVRTASLRAVLESKVDALRVWAGTQRAEAERWAADPEVVEAVRRLEAQARAGATREALWASPARAQFVNALAPFFADRDSVAINAVDPSGRIIATRVEGHIGARVGPSLLADLAPVFKGESRYVSPRPETERLPEVKKSAYDRPIVWFAAPVRASDGRVIAALELGLYADTRFAGLFGLGWLTESESTVEGYAFDDNGLLLTKSRYFPQLRDAGLLPPGATTAAFNLRLREPGFELGPDTPRPLDLEARPFTPLVERAIASRSDNDTRAHEGVLLEPLPQLRRARGHRRLALAARVRHRDRGRGVARGGVRADPFPHDRFSGGVRDAGDRGGRGAWLDVLDRAAPARGPPARRLPAGGQDRRGRHGDGASRGPRAC